MATSSGHRRNSSWSGVPDLNIQRSFRVLSQDDVPLDPPRRSSWSGMTLRHRLRQLIGTGKLDRRTMIGLLTGLLMVLSGAVLLLPHKIVPFRSEGVFAFPSTTSSSSNGPTISPHFHPIAQLTSLAERKWHDLLSLQSRTLQSAVTEYRRRYNRPPPKGFDAWWTFASEKGLKLTDEFDQIDRDLAPFWGLSPTQINERHVQLLDAQSDRILSLVITNGTISDEPGPASTELWPMNKEYYNILKNVAPFLPDLRIAINLHDVPVIYVSWEERQRLIKAGLEGVFAHDQYEISLPQQEAAKGQQFSYIDLRSSCPPDSPGRDYQTDILGTEFFPDTETTDLSFKLPDHQGGFIHAVNKQMDVCYNPALKDQHGYFLKSDLYMRGLKRNRLYPLFSWTRFKGSSDIMIPTTYRFDHSNNKGGKPWADLIPKLVWRGSLTGIWPASEVNAFASQRWRLWATVQDKFRRLPILVSSGTGFMTSTIQGIRAAAEWLDVGPVEFYWGTMAESAEGQAAVALYHMDGKVSNDQRNTYKALLDVDGWGWSARYRELLRTKSAVFKATVYEEVWTSWLIPWYHYIPISYAYDDLHSILLYYFGIPGTDQEPHDEELKLIGQRGQEWADEHASWEHLTTYTYRLMLEWARLMTDDRASMDYVG